MTTDISNHLYEQRASAPSTRARFAPRAVLEGLWAPQKSRWLLLGPLALMAGAAAHLAAPQDPPAFVGVGLLVAGALLAALCWGWPVRKVRPVVDALRLGLGFLSMLCACAGAGLTAAELRVRTVSAPRLEAPLESVRLTGHVLAVDPSGERMRMRILVAELGDLTGPPRLVTVTTDAPLSPGRPVDCLARLGPPAPPLGPGAYDPEARAFFRGIGASGFALGRCRVWGEARPPRAFLDRAALKLSAVRADLTAMIAATAPGVGGGLAAALITGDASAVAPDAMDALRDSGLGHLISVSGLHMSLVAGMAFGGLLFGLAMIPGLALVAPVRKIAAAGAICACAGYLALSGASLPAQRAFLMTGVVFGAILIDRPALSMRGLALAGVLIVLVEPEAVLDAGFQMSFAATAALVALFETTWGRPGRGLPSPGPIIGGLQNATAAVTGVLATSFVAGAATDLLVAYHFQRLSLYGLASNLTTAPIVSFIVAPAAAVAAVSAPFGFSDIPLRVMAWGMDLVAGVGAVFAARPEAVAAFPAAPPLMLILTLGGLAWLVVFRGPMRALGLLGLGGAVWLAATSPAPDVLMDQSARTVLVRADDEGWRLIGPSRGGDYARERLAGFAGIAPRMAKELPAPMACSDPARACTVFVGGAPVTIGLREKGRGRNDAPTLAVDGGPTVAEDAKAAPAAAPIALAASAPCGPNALLIATRLGAPPQAAATGAGPPCAPILLDPAKDGGGGIWLYRDARAEGGWRIAPARAHGFSRPWARPGFTDSGE